MGHRDPGDAVQHLLHHSFLFRGVIPPQTLLYTGIMLQAMSELCHITGKGHNVSLPDLPKLKILNGCGGQGVFVFLERKLTFQFK